MGEKQTGPFQLIFNVSPTIDFPSSRVTSDGGLIVVRELGERLSQDPTFRLIGSEKIWDRGVAPTSRVQSFETGMLAEEENFAGLARINRELIGKAEVRSSIEGGCLGATLRSGNVHGADGWEDMPLPEGPEGAPRQQKQGKEVVFRADAAFAKSYSPGLVRRKLEQLLYANQTSD
jgi:hypothetical protein